VRAGVSSFGIGGTNAHAVLQEAPPAPQRHRSSEPQLLLLSARSATALDRLTNDLARHLGRRPDVPLALPTAPDVRRPRPARSPRAAPPRLSTECSCSSSTRSFAVRCWLAGGASSPELVRKDQPTTRRARPRRRSGAALPSGDSHFSERTTVQIPSDGLRVPEGLFDLHPLGVQLLDPPRAAGLVRQRSREWPGCPVQPAIGSCVGRLRAFAAAWPTLRGLVRSHQVHAKSMAVAR
jgi:ketoacyl-synthetase-like protein